VNLRSRVVCESGCIAGKRILKFASQPQVLADWSLSDGLLLRQEMERAYETLAESVAEVYFPRR
jgi:hypothetical protein